tara:strand:- start:1250 stop:1555 length:306 start_codon:yes stop_codon:yes gene_type:complete
MGLTKDFTTGGGLTATGAYHRIGHLSLQIDKDDDDSTVVLVNWNIEIHKDAASREAGAPPVGGFNARSELNLAGSANQYNLIKQGYIHLKTLDDYTDAVDN